MKRHKNLIIYEHTVSVDCGGGAVMTIVNAANDNTHIEWQQRYCPVATLEKNRMSVASLLCSYDYLLSGEISQKEAIARLKLLRQGRKDSLMCNDQR